MNSADLFDNHPKVKKNRLNLLPPNPEPEAKGRFPSWLHRSLPKGGSIFKTGEILANNRLPTVCEEAKCPNLLECWSQKTATFLTMGKSCTRNCGFCSIDFSKTPPPLEMDEPLRVAQSVKALGLKHVVLTMVARDDLEDGGALHLTKIVETIRAECERTSIELLTSDFSGNQEAWKTVLSANPEVLNYNIETVRELTPRVRHKATYERTLQFLSFAKKHLKTDQRLKSGLMVGLGETESQVFQTLTDLKKVGCDIVTIGQYLQPATHKLLVKEFIHPEQFKKYERFGLELGISQIHAGPFVRSSYHASTLYP